MVNRWLTDEPGAPISAQQSAILFSQTVTKRVESWRKINRLRYNFGYCG